jgi:pimeloyl-ACP methyl ester carboxylesterase
MVTEGRPVVFAHGLWLRSSSWDRWVDLFSTRGYAAVAPGWPGEEPAAGERPEHRPPPGLDEVRAHYARSTERLGGHPVLIGHGLGGLLVRALAEETHAAGVIAIEAWPATVVSTAAGAAAAGGGSGAIALSPGEFHLVFGSSLSRAESDRLYERWAIPAPRRLLRDAVAPDAFAPKAGTFAVNSGPGPVLLIMSGDSWRRAEGQEPPGGLDHLAAVTDFMEFPDRGPSLVIDNGWHAVAESCLSWMDAQEL